MKIEDIIKEIQKNVGTEIDGRGGPETWLTIYKVLVEPTLFKPRTSLALSPVDAASEEMIANLKSPVQLMARSLVQKAHMAGIKIKIIRGYRSYEEQDALYAQGRTTPGEIATKIKAGYCNYNFGIAFDFAVFEGSTLLLDSPKYKAVGVLGMDMGLDWGGNWRNDDHQEHFQLKPAWANDLSQTQMLSVLRERFIKGRSIYA